MSENNPNRSVLLIYTGGTIGMKPNKNGVLVPFDFASIYDEFPHLSQLSVDIEVADFDPIDSSNVTPELWIGLAELIRQHYERFDGFVILHGTDTMAYTASALSFMLENLSKPIILTGSQIPIGVLRTDGRENLITAIEMAAAHENGRSIVPEVCIYFQDRLMRANRTTKYSAEELSAFRSENYPPLAEVGVSIQFNRPYIYPMKENLPLRIHQVLEDRVAVIRIFPGLRSDIFEGMLSAAGLRAIVLQTYGAGNAPTSERFMAPLRRAIARGLLVLNVTQCAEGAVKMEIYETGRILQEAGVISGGDMTLESALTKLMVLLGQTDDMKWVIQQLNCSIRGEITM